MPQAPLIIIQARLGSKRLPGKVLMPINGKPMLRYLWERVNGDARIATPDPEIADAWPGGGMVTFLPDDDVAGRFVEMIEMEDERPHTFIRLCGDSPLMDPALIDAAVAIYEPPYLEIRSPVGCVEVCNTEFFLKQVPRMNAEEREHVTLGMRPYGASLSIGPEDCPRLVVDEQEDFDRVRGVIEKMDRPHTDYGWRECVSLL